MSPQSSRQCQALHDSSTCSFAASPSPTRLMSRSATLASSSLLTRQVSWKVHLCAIVFSPISRLTRLQHLPSSTSLSSQPTPSMRPPHYRTPNTPTVTTIPIHNLLPPQHFRSRFPLSSRPFRSSASPTPRHPSHHGRATLLTRPAQPLQETTYWVA